MRYGILEDTDGGVMIKLKNPTILFLFLCVVPQQFNVPAAAWAKGKDIEASPSMSPYQCSKLNPEMEMTVRQNFNFRRPTYQSDC